MTAAHSMGPWEVEPEDDGMGDLVILSRDIHMVASVSRCYKGDRVPEKEAANARLIAAAPELLAALQAALSVIDDYLAYEHNGDPWVEDARAMGEMDIDDYRRDGRLDAARSVVAKATGAA